MNEKHVAIYLRVSSKGQDHRSQLPDLERWAAGQEHPVRWYRDKFTGRVMDRSGWHDLESNIEAGTVSGVVVWRLDRLGRTASGLTTLFDDLRRRKVNLLSLRDGLDLETPAGRLISPLFYPDFSAHGRVGASNLQSAAIARSGSR